MADWRKPGRAGWWSTDRTLIVIGFVLQLVLTTVVQTLATSSSAEQLESEKSLLENKKAIFSHMLDAEGAIRVLLAEADPERHGYVISTSDDRRLKAIVDKAHDDCLDFVKRYFGAMPLAARPFVTDALVALDEAVVDPQWNERLGLKAGTAYVGVDIEYRKAHEDLSRAEVLLSKAIAVGSGSPLPADFSNVVAGSSSAPWIN